MKPFVHGQPAINGHAAHEGLGSGPSVARVLAGRSQEPNQEGMADRDGGGEDKAEIKVGERA